MHYHDMKALLAVVRLCFVDHYSIHWARPETIVHITTNNLWDILNHGDSVLQVTVTPKPHSLKQGFFSPEGTILRVEYLHLQKSGANICFLAASILHLFVVLFFFYFLFTSHFGRAAVSYTSFYVLNSSVCKKAAHTAIHTHNDF